jgi:hypothetical protein
MLHLMHAPELRPVSLSRTRHRRAAIAGVLAVAALAAIPGAASAAIHVENAKSIQATEGLAFANQRVVEFDEAGACNPANYAVTVNWGDGTAPTPATVFKTIDASPGTCNYGANAGHTYATAGRLTVTATICNTATTECVTTPVGGQVTVAAATSAPAPAPTAAPTEAAATVAEQPAAAPEPAAAVTNGPAALATPTLAVLGPVTLSQLRHAGLRLRLGAGAVTSRTLTVLLADPASGRTLGRARVHVTPRGAAAGAETTVRVRFSRTALRHLRHGRRYGLRIPRGGGLPSLAAQFRVR